MSKDNRRITLVARHPGQMRNWSDSLFAHSRVIFIDAFTVLRHALEGGLSAYCADIQRVIIDRCGSAMQFLELLAALPSEFVGDVVFVRADGSGFLSALGRGGDRIVYTLRPADIDFYLATNKLIEAAIPTIEALPNVRTA